MNHSETLHNARPEKKWRTINVWYIKGPLIIVGLLLGIFDRAFFHWGRASLAAGVAMILTIIGFRDFWNEVRFWITVGLLGVAQVPLVIEVTPLMKAFGFPFMLIFAILDGLLVIGAISWVCSEQRN